jgi:hypothetical protein
METISAILAVALILTGTILNKHHKLKEKEIATTAISLICLLKH